MLDHVVQLDRLEERHRALAGPKAWTLARLRRRGLPAVSGFCILANVYRQAVATVPNSADELEAFRQAIQACAMPAGLEAALERHLGAEQVVVRSSATLEDLPEHSAAGQHDSFLGVQGLEACLQAIRSCWASLWSDRAFAYREGRGLDQRQAGMAVLICPQLTPLWSGVIFTRDPRTGANRLVVEASSGLGQDLVGGRLSPQLLILRRSDQSCLESNGQPGLDQPTAARLGLLALEAETLLGCPQDLEWAVTADGIFLLQARPITALPDPETVTVWTNANAGEVMQEVMTPLTWTVVETFAVHIFTSFFGTLGLEFGDGQLVKAIAGRPYFNLNTLYRLAQELMVVSGRDVTEIFGGHHELPQPPPLPTGWPLARWRLRQARRLSQLLVQVAVRTPLRAGVYLESLKRTTEELDQVRLQSLEDVCLEHRFQGLHQFSLDFAQGLNCAGVGLLGYFALYALCRRWLGEASLANRLLVGVGGVESARPALELWELAQEARVRPALRELLSQDLEHSELRQRLPADWLSKWDLFLARHGHHAQGEIELNTPRWAERPELILGVLRGYIAEGDRHDPRRHQQQRVTEREELLRQCRQRLGWPQALLLRGCLNLAQWGLRVRENLKNLGVRRIFQERLVALEIGRRLVDRGDLRQVDDIFFLLPHEVRLRSPDAATQETVDLRRREYLYHRTLTPPPVIIGTFHTGGTSAPVGESIPPSTNELRGLGVSPGRTQGRARVILAGNDHERVRPGEILVAPFTDAGWALHYMTAAALVCDLGGLLSHGAIIAREYGIPAVVNVGRATKLVRTGQWLEVDGDQGTVSLLPDP